jgi:hypothetical protein
MKKKMKNNREVIYHNKRYSSMANLIRETGIPERTAYRMKKRGEITKAPVPAKNFITHKDPNWREKLDKALDRLFGERESTA